MKSLRAAAGLDHERFTIAELARDVRLRAPITLWRVLDAVQVVRQQVLLRGLTSDEYAARFELQRAGGFAPVWLDAYQVDGETFFNAIWQPAHDVPWDARRNMNWAEFQIAFDVNQQRGYRLINLRSYRDGAASDGHALYSAIWVNEPGPEQRVYHGKSMAEHEALFQSLVGAGYVPVNLSVVHLGDVREVSGLYLKVNVGSVVAKQTLAWNEVAKEVAANRKAGRHLVYLTSWKTVSAESAYSAIFWQRAPGHGDVGVSFQIPEERFDGEIASYMQENGCVARSLTGAEQGSGEGWLHGYSAVWRRL